MSLQKWAKLKGFKVNWNPKSKDVVVTSRWSKLKFTVDSRKAEINGVTVWLSAAIPASGNTVYVGERDIKTMIEPVLYPPRVAKGKRVRTVAVCAGHGGKDPGYQINSHQEKKYALMLARALKEALESSGLKVVMIRDADVYVSLEDQAAKANQAKADIFVTVHYNAAAEVEAKGSETYCLTPAGATPTNGGGEPSARSSGNKNDPLNALLAYQVQKAILQQTELADRGVRRAGFMVLRNITMPGILVEGGFMSNPFDARKIHDPRYRRKMARAIADGILAYKRTVERK